MASPETKEGREPLVNERIDFPEASDLQEGVKSVDAQETPTPAVEHEGVYLVKPVESERRIFDKYSQEEIQRMASGKIEESSTWLGKFIKRIKEIVSFRKKEGLHEGTA